MDSGNIKLEGGTIRYEFRGQELWNIALPHVRVIGEATTDHGPWLDDCFFCFSTGPDSWYEASFYSEGSDDFLKALEAKLGVELRLKLMGSTDFASNVLWPPALAGKPMFKYRDVPAKAWLARLIGLGRNEQTFSEEVVEFLKVGLTNRST
jgi:hypothetical protein